MIKNSIGAILIIIVFGILLILIFNFLKKNKVLIKEFFKTGISLNKKIYTFEIVVVFLAIIIFAGYLFHRSTVGFAVVSLFLLIIIYFVGIFYIKDYVAGLIIKVSETFKLNETINIGNYEGKVTRFCKRCLILEKDGEQLLVPYSKLIGAVSHIKTKEDVAQSFIFNIKIKCTQDTDLLILERKLKDFISTLPWVNHTLNPEIKFNKDENGFTNFEFNVYTYSLKYNKKIEESVTKMLKSISKN